MYLKIVELYLKITMKSERKHGKKEEEEKNKYITILYVFFFFTFYAQCFYFMFSFYSFFFCVEASFTFEHKVVLTVDT